MYELGFIVGGGIILLCIGILFGHSFRDVEKKIQPKDDHDLKPYLQAMEFAANSDFDSAIEIIATDVKVNPHNLFMLLTLGNFYREKGQFEKAIRIHKGILAKTDLTDDLKYQTMFSLGLDYKDAGFIDRGIKIFTQIQKLDKGNPIYFKFLKELYEDSNDWETAFETEVKLIKLQNSKNFLNLAYLKSRIGKELFDDGRYAKAIKCFKEAIKLDKTCFLPYMHLGDTFIQMEKNDAAENVFKKGIKQKPKLAFLVYDRFEKLYSEAYNKPSEKLIRLYFNVLEKVADDIPTLLKLAEYYENNEMFKDAETTYEKIINLFPNHLIARKKLTQLYFNSDQTDKAYQSYYNILNAETLEEKTYICDNCRYKSNWFFWRCPHCKTWDTFVQGIEKGLG